MKNNILFQIWKFYLNIIKSIGFFLYLIVILNIKNLLFVLKTYVTSIYYKNSELEFQKFEYNSNTVKDKKVFMLYTAFLLVGIYLFYNYLSYPPLKQLQISENTNHFKEIASSLFFFGKGNNKVPTWIKIICLLILMNYMPTILGVKPEDNLFLNVKFVTGFLWLGVCAYIFQILNYILSIYLIVRLSKDNLEIPKYLPKFILNYIADHKTFDNDKQKEDLILFYFHMLFLYIIVFILALIILYIIYKLFKISYPFTII